MMNFGYYCPACGLHFWVPTGESDCPRCDYTGTFAYGPWPGSLPPPSLPRTSVTALLPTRALV